MQVKLQNYRLLEIRNNRTAGCQLINQYHFAILDINLTQGNARISTDYCPLLPKNTWQFYIKPTTCVSTILAVIIHSYGYFTYYECARVRIYTYKLVRMYVQREICMYLSRYVDK